MLWVLNQWGGRAVAAVANRTPTPGGPDRARGGAGAGPQYGCQLPGSLVHESEQGLAHWLVKRLLPFARSSVIGREGIA